MTTPFPLLRTARRLLLALAVVGGLAATTPARAEPPPGDSLSQELEALAKDVKKLLDGRNETAIAVGQFVPLPSAGNASAGPAFAKGLTEELKKAGVDVRQRANLTIEGRYGLNEDKESGLPAVALNVKILDKTGEEVVGLKLKPRGIFGNATLAALLGLTVNLPPGEEHREKKLEDSAEKPQVDVAKARVRAPGAPYAVEILVKGPDGKFAPRPATEKDGQAFVELKADDVYRVRVVNESDYEAAVQVSIDGLNMFAFSEVKNKETGRPLYDRVLIPAKHAFDVPGWHRNNDKNGSDEFLVTKYADSEAARMLQSSANVGTITVTFAAAWAKDGPRPPDEPAARDATPDLGTKRGSPTGDGYKEVERDFGVTRAAVSVRYSK